MGPVLRSRHLFACLLALVVLAGFVLLLPRGAARAVEETSDARVVRELPQRRGAYQTTYQLSNGLFRTVFSQSPVHYKDTHGDWQPIDLTLRETADGGYQTSAAAVTVRFAAGADGPPVVLEGSGGRVTMDLLGAREQRPSVEGARALYRSVATDVDALYEATGDGVKEALILSSARAPAAFTYALTHSGLELRQDKSGQWGLYGAASKRPCFLLGPLTVFDSSSDDGAMPAFCDDARMTVDPGIGKSTVTYALPPKWLSDPARVFPVVVDPQLYTRAPTDTYISQGYPNTAYGSSAELLCGNVSTTTKTCNTLVKFPQLDNPANVPTAAHITAATFSIRQFWQPTTNKDDVKIGRVDASSTNWGDASTWNTTTLVVDPMVTKTTTAIQQWVDVICPGVVQGWVRGDYANKGFVLYEGSTLATYARKFRSAEYSDATYRPNLTVDWEEPSATIASPAVDAKSRIGDKVTVVVAINNVADPSQITDIRMGINRTDTNTSRRRGVMAWFSSKPAAPWVAVKKATGSWLAYYDSTAYGAQHITPLLSECFVNNDAAPTQATFVFRVNDSFGNTQDNDFDTYLAMTAGSNDWTTGWVNRNRNLDMLPKPLTWLSASTTASAWFTGTPPNDTTDQGRGTVTLSWAPAPAATGYTVHLWDGVKYNQVSSVTGTTWTSPANLYPTDSQIAAMAQGYTGNPFATYGSRDLRDNPNDLYNKMLPVGQTSNSTAYRFIVSPSNTAGALPAADNFALSVTLDKRSLEANEDPQFTTYDFGSWNGHTLAAELNTGRLTSTVTDLEIATWGPSAGVSRTYSSGVTTAGAFAPGWFFGFERNLQIGTSQVVYTDPERHTHTFTGSGATWTAPNGFFATLAPGAGSTWVMTFNDQSSLTFDSVGRLIAEKDRNGNTTTYTWSSGLVTQIAAANGQTIALTWSAGKLASVSYATSAGTRTVSYTTAAPWRATYFPGTAVERTVTYGYDNSRLSSITQEDWPATGQSAMAGFTYVGGALTEVGYPDRYSTTLPRTVVKADARATVAYGANQAAVCRYGKVGDVANQEMNKEVVVWDPLTGLLTSREYGTTNPTTTTYDYAPELQLASVTVLDGSDVLSLSLSEFDENGDLVEDTSVADSADSTNQTTTYLYDQQHRVVEETVTQAPGVSLTTHYTYDTRGNVTEMVQSAADGSCLYALRHEFDALGRLIVERQLVTGTPASGTWAVRQFSNFSVNGSPQTTVANGVQLAYGGPVIDLTEYATFDAFGGLLSRTDWSGVRIAEVHSYDMAGNRLTSTDACGVTTHWAYDRLGNATETWRSVLGQATKADWSVTTYDAMGRPTAVTRKLSDASGNPTTQSVVTNTYDGSGNQLSSGDSTVTGSEKWVYNQFGRPVKHWSMGVYDTTDARSTRTDYDGEGRTTGEIAPGSSAAFGALGSTVTTYDDAGQVLEVTRPDGSWETYTYDGTGGRTSHTFSAPNAADLAPAIRVFTYDPASRLTSETNRSGFGTRVGHDLFGRRTSAAGESQATTLTHYNNLGWILRIEDASGVTTSRAYDTHGCVVSETVGSQGTSSWTYDNAGRILTRITPNGDTLTYTYDDFGNRLTEAHQGYGGATLKNSSWTHDSLGRPLTLTDSISGLQRTWTYPVNTQGGVQETLRYDAIPLTRTDIARNARGVETTRTTTIGTSNTVTRTTADTTAGRDTADRWIQATIAKSGASTVTLNRGFDNAGHLTSQSGAGFSSAGSYTYDAGSRQKTAESLPLSLGGTITGVYTYTADRRLATATVGGVTGSYSFDGAGNLISNTEGSVTTTFEYDTANRLTGSSDGTTKTLYRWDTTNGWRTSRGPDTNPYQIQYTYTKSGGSTSIGRLMRYQNSATSTDASYTYDGQGQRTRTVVTVGGTTTTSDYTYDGLALLKLSATQGSTSWRIDYLYDQEGTPYGGIYRSPASSTSPTYFTMITSDRGDVLELLDGKGAAFAAYRYDAWGVARGSGNYGTGIWTQSTSLITSTLAGAIANRQVLRYAGYAWDSHSGLYYCSARCYDPVTRQWTTADPAKADQEEGAYQYCRANPVVAVDPSGLAYISKMIYFHETVNTKNYDTSDWNCYVEIGYGDLDAYRWVPRKVWYDIKALGVMVSAYRRLGVWEWSAGLWVRRRYIYEPDVGVSFDFVNKVPYTYEWPIPWVATRKYHYVDGVKKPSTMITVKHQLYSYYLPSTLQGYFYGYIKLPVR